ncbi:hypothetical protein B0H16DRAFT_1805810 [Mycena metata]|uniref:Uncharacterized protein n=1 Tax=Mycena metata TaxID=1033252 RepID=A0AAD7JGJ9_9AGAR|nr:hypothetical protein B0H16DRAFT_1805810 [Mycena metata]
MLADVPPPTTHSVPKPQRLRLMRSTRKLTAILGTTPFLVDRLESMPLSPSPSPLEPANSAAIPSIISVLSGEDRAERDSVALMPAPSSTSSSHPHRPTLLLRINTARANATRRQSNSHSHSQAWGRPASIALPLPSPLSPISPSWADSENGTGAAAARRKKMARLTRTLGENVPPELVFPSGAPSASTASALPRPRTPRTPCTPRSSISSVATATAAEEKPYPLDLAEESEDSLPSPVLFKSATDLGAGRHSTSSSASERWLPSSLRRASSQQYRNQQVVRRMETGWVGEWNRDEETVVRGLRELK